MMTTSASPSGHIEMYTNTVRRLRTIGCDRLDWLAHNPDGKSGHELNQLIPEINDIELDNQPAKASPSDTLHVAAWNLERGRHWRDAVKLFQQHPRLRRVDILCLSEMDDGMARSQNEHTPRELALALGMNYVYGVEFLQLSLGTPQEQAEVAGTNSRGYHGNAILSRFPLQSPSLLRLPGIEKWYGSFEHRLGGRLALFADIQLGDRTITIVSTHLESGETETEKRAQEGQLILAAIATYYGDRSVIVCGDLNSRPNAPVINHFRAAGFLVEETNDLTRSTYQLIENGLIQPGNFHIDYVMARGFQVAEAAKSAVIMAAYPCEPTGKMLSDHAIVTTTLQLA
ncbi:MAG: endonuclease/exonuclease/phosphatase family protein [Cyanobacteria bacterium P01_D01_bin.71]